MTKTDELGETTGGEHDVGVANIGDGENIALDDGGRSGGTCFPGGGLGVDQLGGSGKRSAQRGVVAGWRGVGNELVKTLYEVTKKGVRGAGGNGIAVGTVSIED